MELFDRRRNQEVCSAWLQMNLQYYFISPPKNVDRVSQALRGNLNGFAAPEIWLLFKAVSISQEFLVGKNNKNKKKNYGTIFKRWKAV